MSEYSVPFLRQPDGISCGATVAAMVLGTLKRRDNKAPVQALYPYIGTNPRTGTTPHGLIRGLSQFGVRAEYSAGDATPERLLALTQGSLVLLRLMAGGYAKHWIMAWRHGHEGIRTADPASGKGYGWEKDGLYQHWAMRGGEVVRVRLGKEYHLPLPQKPAIPGPWIPLPEQNDYWMLSRDAPVHTEISEEEVKQAVLLSARDGYLVPLPTQSDARTDCVFSIMGGWGLHEHLVVRSNHGDLMGGIALGQVWVVPEYRGQGLAKEMIWIASRPENAVHATLYPTHPKNEKCSRLFAATQRLALERMGHKNTQTHDFH